ncbi:AAA family ATPase [Mameliella sp. CS4]|uniref:GumC family protein n=1 Tax=Mameliella sp. CS4 TaxID=2862329 RepID=UPI001C5E0D2A|nr:Wzz/FepE/Etk N-terminal domain-containing protein [Mameliella sp. CS4]MBW4985714.1 AAA family ATPase [Mameliella sp. CS4]
MPRETGTHDDFLREPHSAPQSGSFDILSLVGLVWRGKWLLLACVVVFTMIGWYYANRIATPLYTANARLSFQIRSQQVVDMESVLSGVSTDLAAINTELEVIRSRRLVSELVDKLSLDEDTEFNGMGPPAPFSIWGIRRKWQELTTGEKFAPGMPDPEALKFRAATAVRGRIQVRPIRSTFLFDILITTNSRTKSALIANTLAQIYIDDQVTQKFEATEYAVDWLTNKVSELEVEIDRQETAIKRFRAQTDLINAESLEGLNIRAQDLRSRIGSISDDLATKRARKSRIEALLAADDMPQAVAEIDDPILSRLRANLLAGDEGAAAAARARLTALVETFSSDTARSEDQLAALRGSLSSLQDQINKQTQDLNTLNQMTRERQATEVLYETILARLKETSVQIGLQQPDSRILSAAISGTPVAPRKLRIQATMALVGMLAGFSFLFLRQFVTDRFRKADDLERAIGLPVIGEIPKLNIKNRSGLLPYLHEHPTSGAMEAIRNLRTSVLMSNIDSPPQVIAITSSIPGEDKTTTALSLARNLGDMGHRVLLVEGDFRRRTLSEYFPNDRFPHTILDLLSGEIPLQDAASYKKELRGDVLLGGVTGDVNAADYFSSERFAQTINDLRAIYDHIIIDTPPVLVVPDARIISRVSDAILYTVLWNGTKSGLVREGIKMLTSVDAPISGLILTKIDIQKMNRYGYEGYGAYSKYGKSYYDRT